MAAALTTSLPIPSDRRRSRRIASTDCGESVRVRVRPGWDATLLNLSRDGACIEVASRLLPGIPVDMQLAISGWFWNGRAKVLRCHVAALFQEDGVRYQAALQFDPPLDPEGEERLNAALLEADQFGYQVPDERVALVPPREAPTRVSSVE
jgi:hypothetical protein